MQHAASVKMADIVETQRAASVQAAENEKYGEDIWKC